MTASDQRRREIDYIERYRRRRLAEEFAAEQRRQAAKPPFSFTRFLGFDR